MSDWKTLAAPTTPAVDSNIPAWQTLGAPVPPEPAQPENLSDKEKFYRMNANTGWLGKLDSALGGFTDQFTRAATMGLNDKVAALTPASIHAAAKGVNALYKAVGADHPFPEAEDENFSDVYHENLAKERGASDRYAENNPYASTAAKALGFVSSVPLTAGAGVPGAAAPIGTSLAAKVGQGAMTGGRLGAIAGFGQANDESLAKDIDATGLGAGVGMALGGVATGLTESTPVQRLGTWVASKFGPDAVEDASVKQILNRIANNESSGGPSAQDMLDIMDANPHKPLMPVDVGGEGVQGLGERIATTPGQGRQIISTALTGRDAGAGVRIGQDLTNAFGSAPPGTSGTGSNYSLAKDLSEIQKANSAPAYDKAFAGGSTAPLEDQFRAAVQQATAGKATIAKQMQAIEKNNPGALAARGAAGADVRAKYMDLAEQASQAEEARQAMLSRFQQAQADKTANAPGAIWSPKLQEFLDDPIMKPGLHRGLEIQRLETVGTGKPFNPTEHAIIGTNPDGTPLVGAVPNMRLVDAGKRGLDALIGDEEVAPGQFTEKGKTLIGFKNRFVDEVKSLNPDYEPALKAFSGPAASKRAIAMGEYAMTSGKVHPDAIVDQLAKLDPGDQELYKLGAMNALRTNVGNATPGANEALKIMGTQNIKDRVTAIAGSPDKAERLIKSAGLEDKMFQTGTKLLGNSRTALRMAEQAQGGENSIVPALAQAAAGMASGEPVVGGMGVLNLGKQLLAATHRPSPAVDAATARMLVSTDLPTNQATLARIMAMSQRPSLTPSLTRPFVQGGAQFFPNQINMPFNRGGGQ